MKVFVTGAAGFIGVQLGNDLAASGYDVVGIDVHDPPPGTDVQFALHRVDFRDTDALRPLLAGSTVVFHLAAAHLAVHLDEAAYRDVNVHSLPRLLETAQALGVERFVHVSSVGVYGRLAAWPANEETPCAPQSVYGETKLAGEQAVRAFHERTGFPTVILRPAWVYGPTCPRTRKLVAALRKRTFVMIGRGQNLRHPLYIRDLLDAFRRSMETPQAVGEVVLLGGPQAHTTREVVDTLCRVFALPPPRLILPMWLGTLLAAAVEVGFRGLNREPPVSRRTLEFFHTTNAFDVSKAERVLGFVPRFSFEAGLRDAYDQLKAS